MLLTRSFRFSPHSSLQGDFHLSSVMETQNNVLLTYLYINDPFVRQPEFHQVIKKRIEEACEEGITHSVW